MIMTILFLSHSNLSIYVDAADSVRDPNKSMIFLESEQTVYHLHLYCVYFAVKRNNFFVIIFIFSIHNV